MGPVVNAEFELVPDAHTKSDLPLVARAMALHLVHPLILRGEFAKHVHSVRLSEAWQYERGTESVAPSKFAEKSAPEEPLEFDCRLCDDSLER